MAITIDATSADTNTGANVAANLSVNHTAAAAADLMLVFVALNVDATETVASVVWNTTENLVQVGTAVSSATGVRTSIWWIAAPFFTTGALAVVVTPSASVRFCAKVRTYLGVDRNNPLGTPQSVSVSGVQTITTPSLASDVGELIQDCLARLNNANPPSANGAQGDVDTDVTTAASAGNNVHLGISTLAGVPVPTMNWTWTTTNREAALIAVPIKPFAPMPGFPPALQVIPR